MFSTILQILLIIYSALVCYSSPENGQITMLYSCSTTSIQASENLCFACYEFSELTDKCLNKNEIELVCCDILEDDIISSGGESEIDDMSEIIPLDTAIDSDFIQPSPELNISFEAGNCDLAEILGNTYIIKWNAAYKRCFHQQKKELKQQFKQFKDDVRFAEKAYKKFLNSRSDLTSADREGIRLHIQSMEDEISMQHDTITEEINNPECSQDTESVTQAQLIKSITFYNGIYDETDSTITNSMIDCLNDYVDDLEDSMDHCLSRMAILFDDESFTDFLCRVKQVDLISDIAQSFLNFKDSLSPNEYDSDSDTDEYYDIDDIIMDETYDEPIEMIKERRNQLTKEIVVLQYQLQVITEDNAELLLQVQNITAEITVLTALLNDMPDNNIDQAIREDIESDLISLNQQKNDLIDQITNTDVQKSEIQQRLQTLLDEEAQLIIELGVVDNNTEMDTLFNPSSNNIADILGPGPVIFNGPDAIDTTNNDKIPLNDITDILEPGPVIFNEPEATVATNVDVITPLSDFSDILEPGPVIFNEPEATDTTKNDETTPLSDISNILEPGPVIIDDQDNLDEATTPTNNNNKPPIDIIVEPLPVIIDSEPSPPSEKGYDSSENTELYIDRLPNEAQESFIDPALVPASSNVYIGPMAALILFSVLVLMSLLFTVICVTTFIKRKNKYRRLHEETIKSSLGEDYKFQIKKLKEKGFENPIFKFYNKN